MREVFANIDIIKSNVLGELKLAKGGYYLVSLHRDENTEIEKNFFDLVNTLTELSKEGLPVIVSTHPRTAKKIEKFNISFPANVVLHKPFGFFDYLTLQLNAKCVISDSGTISEESSLLQFPAVTIRNAIERPEAIDVGSIIISPLNYVSLQTAMQVAINNKDYSVPQDYNISNFSERVLRVILGYTNYVNKYMWYK
jgi:UDP-N-acetylglucosamine 2-epimerase (non-hydrolysing)